MTSFNYAHNFNKAVIHIDGDAFFASCEQSRRPELKGKPVITGQERGIASSMSYEAKAKGITRGMPIYQIRRICPEAVILPSDYETYSLLSRRLYSIVRRYTHLVEEYGIDECFAEITGSQKQFNCTYLSLAQKIKNDLDKELGFTFSVGLAPNKVLAKIGSKWKKPSGLTHISHQNRWKFLDKYPVANVWGIGPATTDFLYRHHIHTAGDFARANEWWIKNNLNKPFWEIWQELNGALMMPLHIEEKSTYYSVQKFKTFTPPSCKKDYIFSQLSKNVENACIKIRRHKLLANNIIIILRSQDFKHSALEIKLNQATAIPLNIISHIRPFFDQLIKSNTLYRATGVILSDLKPKIIQPDLFTNGLHLKKVTTLYENIDELAKKYGKHTIFLGSSFTAQTTESHLNERQNLPERQTNRLPGENYRQHLNIPMLFAKI